MKAITYSRHGGPEVLELTDIPLPEPAADQVRVRVHAASVNPIDIKRRRGDLASVMPVSFPVRPGIDFAGVIDAVGSDDGEHRVGDDVLGFAISGSYAEFALAEVVTAKPADLSWELAASLPTVGETAARVLRDLNLPDGGTLLVHGAAGGVGSIATQLGASRGITVIGVSGAAGADVVRAHAAAHVGYDEDLVQSVRALAPQGVDRALDASGRGVLPALIELTGSPERVITIADGSAQRHGVRFSGAGGGERAFAELPELAQQTATGALEITVWRTYPLVHAGTAHADIEAGVNRGKIVLIP
ncbi:MAG: NADP-dependent oxidoreductase [Solirubrobacteraceae bacterium]